MSQFFFFFFVRSESRPAILDLLIIPITWRRLPVNGGENVNLIIVLLLHCSAEIGLVRSVLLGPV